jgi:Protein of unknown function (DUF1579)
MAKESKEQSSIPNPLLKRLEPLAGEWETRGWTRKTSSAPALEIVATDTYEWIAAGFVLLHLVDARVGGEQVQGAEILGYDPSRQGIFTQYFGSDGPNRYEAKMSDEKGELVWKMWSERDRFTGTFSEEGTVITGHWELLDSNGSWQPWMDITLTKI